MNEYLTQHLNPEKKFAEPIIIEKGAPSELPASYPPPPPLPLFPGVDVKPKRGRPKKNATEADTKKELDKSDIQELAKKHLGVEIPDDVLEDEELTKAKNELLTSYLIAPEFFGELTEAKIAKMKDMEKVKMELEHSKLRIYGQYNGQISEAIIKVMNFIPKKLFKMDQEKSEKLDKTVAEDKALNQLTKYHLSVTLLNLIPNVVKWGVLYAFDVVKCL